VAGVIKTVMALRNGVLPQTLHIDEPTPHVDWEAGEIELLREPKTWEPGVGPRRAGVSSFGISGTNAHLILEEAPATEAPVESEQDAPPLPAIPLLLSAKSAEALPAQAERLASHLQDNPELDPTDVGFSLATSRATLEHRAAIVGSDRDSLLEELTSLAKGEPGANLVSTKALTAKTAFMFTGQGAQRPEMGAGLYESFPAYAKALDEICEQLDPRLRLSLKDHLFAEEGSSEAKALDRTELTQPALFALEVSLFRLLESLGLAPDFLIGHSIGEIAAAHVGGVLSLPDACELVAARGALMGALPEGGAMVALQGSEQEVAESLEGIEGLSLAAINDPGSVVVSGEEKAALELLQSWKAKGRKATRLRVSHAFHSQLMEPMLEEFTEVAAKLDFQAPKIAIASNLTGEILTSEQATSPAYWASLVREPVRFMAGVEQLQGLGVTRWLELGPDGVLCASARSCLQEDQALLAPLLRKGRGDHETFLLALASAWAHGAKVDWASLFSPHSPKRVPLPTYAFQRRRYWLESGTGNADASAIGQAPTDHPLLGAIVSLAGGEETLFSGRLSLKTHPWLQDHVVHATAIAPGTAFVEMALFAGEETGSPEIEELTLEAPLVLPEKGAVQLQVKVSEQQEQGRREIEIHSRPQPEAGEEAAEWERNASGFLAAESEQSVPEIGEWPPQGAEEVEVEAIYDRAAELGLDYGPAFQGVTSGWKRGEELFAEISLPEEIADAGRWGVHPALLDAALHPIFIDAGVSGEGLRVPFDWRGIRLHASGAAVLRARIHLGEGRLSFSLGDESGAPVLSIDSLATRLIDPAALRSSAAPEDLFSLQWAEISTPPVVEREVEVFECLPDPALDPPAAALELCSRVLNTLQAAIEKEEPLAFLTHGACSVAEGDPADLAAASVWGLVRSAQAEHPGLFSLVDSDEADASKEVFASALANEAEPQLAIREGTLLVPRLARAETSPDAGESPDLDAAADAGDPDSTVLITGGLSGLGALFASRLAAQGARNLLLVSRSGPEAEGAAELKAELTELGAEVHIAACDVSEREELADLLASIPAEHPLGTVIHCAAVIDDGTIEALDPERLATAMAPKANAAWHLHELTREISLTRFVLFSSVAGTFNHPGQGNYAAANAFLDGLAERRRAEGLPAVALGWGAGAKESAMTAHLGEADLARLARLGIAPLDEEQEIELFDRALSLDRARLLPVALDRGALRAAARQGALSPLFGDLVRVPVRRGGESRGSLARRLVGVPEAEWDAAILALVRGHVATVLGHGTAEAIDPEMPFKDLGFDSLAAVELRNHLTQATGMRLPTTLVFDYPTAAAVAEFVRSELGDGDGARASVDEQIDKLESMLEALAADEREQADKRLRTLLTRREREGAEADAVDRIQSASAEEILEIVNLEIGAG
jgi:polyene macrolide polyketide synthase